MSRRQITVLGECVADAFTEPPNASNELALRVLPGGGPANTAVSLARLGTPARFLARLSGDMFGRLFRAHSEASGVDLLHHLNARGLLGGRLADLGLDDVTEACRFGTRVAALTCSVAGPNPPRQEQLAQFTAAGGA